jgi:hypothetical protein
MDSSTPNWRREARVSVLARRAAEQLPCHSELFSSRKLQ